MVAAVAVAVDIAITMAVVVDIAITMAVVVDIVMAMPGGVSHSISFLISRLDANLRIGAWR